MRKSGIIGAIICLTSFNLYSQTCEDLKSYIDSNLNDERCSALQSILQDAGDRDLCEVGELLGELTCEQLKAILTEAQELDNSRILANTKLVPVTDGSHYGYNISVFQKTGISCSSAF